MVNLKHIEKYLKLIVMSLVVPSLSIGIVLCSVGGSSANILISRVCRSLFFVEKICIDFRIKYCERPTVALSIVGRQANTGSLQ